MERRHCIKSFIVGSALLDCPSHFSTEKVTCVGLMTDHKATASHRVLAARGENGKHADAPEPKPCRRVCSRFFAHFQAKLRSTATHSCSAKTLRKSS